MRWTDLAGPDLAPETSLGLLAIGLALLDAALWPRRPGRAPAVLTLGGLLVALSLSLQAWDPVSLGRHGLLYADPVAAFADLLILGGAVLAGLLMAGSPAAAGSRAAAGVLTALGVLGAMVAVSARDLVVLFIGLELASASLIAGNALGPAAAARAVLRQAGPMAAATGLTLLGIACLWAGAGTSQWDHLARGAAAGSAAMTVVGGGLLLTGLAVRAGAVPFHYWVGEIGAGCAPSAVMLTVAVSVVPALVVGGRLVEVLAEVRPDLPSLLLAASLVTVTAGNLLALPRRRLTRLLGYGVVIQAGYGLAALAAGPGPSPGLWLQLTAAVLALGGGLAVSGLIGRAGTAAGLARREPVAGAALCVCLIALAGLPPTAAFASRAALLAGLAETSSAGFVLLLANALLTAWVFLRFAARVAWGREQSPEALAPDAGGLSAAVLSAGLLLLLGLWPAPVARAAEVAGAAAGFR